MRDSVTASRIANAASAAMAVTASGGLLHVGEH